MEFSIKVKHLKNAWCSSGIRDAEGVIYAVIWLNITSGDFLSTEQKKKINLVLLLNQKALGMYLQYGILSLWHSFQLYMLAASPLIIKYLMYF